MNKFLKKILGGETKTKARRERSPRVRIPVLDQAVFVSMEGKKFPLLNLSETGLALLSENEHFPEEASGEIHVGGEKVDVKLRVVRRSGNEVGLHFSADSALVRGLLRRVFGSEIQAQAMTEVDPDLQKKVTVGTPHWFYAPGNHELFYVEHEGKVIRFELEWNGNLLVFADGSLRFGLIDRRDSHDQDKVKHAQSSLVKWADQVKDADKVKAARMLENIKALDAGAKKQMQDLLRLTKG